tara:strand:- start:468 stop:1208 length:741 start_codon:yes stop_codon:yes gene_type:complete
MKIIFTGLLFFSCFFTKANTISVLTYNVNYHFINKKVVSILDSINADVICLQETNKAWEDIIRAGLTSKYPFIEFKHRGTAGGYATLSKYPIIKNESIRNKAGWFPCWLITIKKEQDSIQILNTHLKPGLTRKGWIGWKAHFKKEEIHIKEIKQFLPKANPNLPVIILGDFNENDKGKTLAWLKGEGFEDALPKFDKRSKTWRFIILRARFDHIVSNNKLQCTNAGVYKLGKSDHFPLLGVFEIKE